MLLQLTAGQVSDHKGARDLLKQLPQAGTLIADRGYDSNWFRNELAARGIASCIPGRKNRKQAIDYDKALYKQRHKVENMFAKLKDWRRIATRYASAPTHSSQPSTLPHLSPSISKNDS